MKSFATLLSIFLSLVICPGDLVAQSSPEQEAWVDQVIQLVYAGTELSAEEDEWLRKVLVLSCECSHKEKQEDIDACTKELLNITGLPETEADFQNMTPEQQRKLQLLSPMTSISTCPN
ncbi:hypothetical protein [Lewinella sp. W8]|uniref:hypothetical protein n=1 Tax=Lewinella sp. W8 TaxID=2528208 RepID=UPI001067C4D9|nr:hypothetical protein [Lewinella sp. W8]MTB53948.1 hypothetical protein [Lewinella sp. W8]